ncbi:MAG: EAL domain-containing protein [Pseudomonadota bacterium]
MQDLSILVFNLDSAQRAAICDVLRKAGYTRLVEAVDSGQAVSALVNSVINLVISDVDLGDLDGWRLTRLIRSGALSISPDAPVIIVSTVYSERIAEATSKEYQVNHFMTLRELDKLPAVVAELAGIEHREVMKSKLLVIEDFHDTVNLIQRVLGNRFDIEVANTGRDGLEAWKRGRHELVLLDVMLPEMSGQEVLKEILAIQPSQAIVMMTAHSSPKRAGELILAGAVDFLPKPFRAEQLRQVCEIAAKREDFVVSNKQFFQHQAELFHEKELAQKTLQAIADGVITTDAQGRVEYLNPMAEKLTGWAVAEAKGQYSAKILNVYQESTLIEVDDPLTKCLRAGVAIQNERPISYRNRDGHELKIDHVTSPIANQKGNLVGAVMVFRDVTEAHELELKLEYQASHDMLTGLTNRAAFEERLKLVLENRLHHQDEYTLCYIDLDQFKVINDTCGHGAGDQLLQHISKVMLQNIRKHSDTLARFGGDEFVLLLEDCPLDQATRIAEQICQSVQEYRFIYDNKTFVIGASIGVVPLTLDVLSVHDLLSMADSACYIAKEKGRNRVHILQVDDKELIQRRGEMQIVSKINEAIETDNFSLFYQRIQALNENNNAGDHIEILVRLNDGNGGYLAPGFFLSAAERYNLSPKLDRWVLTATLRTLAEHEDYLSRLDICAINLSGLSFCDETFAAFVEQQFEVFGIPPRKICFEVTETAAIGNIALASDFIHRIRSLGCSFALDDFGSGMSSFAYLKRLPIDFLKIDGLFVKDILIDSFDRAMVNSINDIGHVFGLKTIAEYVETPAVAAELNKIGIDYVQGYAISKPEPLEVLLMSARETSQFA